MATTLQNQNRIYLMLAEGDGYTQVYLSRFHPDEKDSQYFDTVPQVSMKSLKQIVALRTALVVAGFDVIDC